MTPEVRRAPLSDVAVSGLASSRQDALRGLSLGAARERRPGWVRCSIGACAWEAAGAAASPGTGEGSRGFGRFAASPSHGVAKRGGLRRYGWSCLQP